ncbi:hypothetical protein KY362_02370 [Candidatus Woesearchaeota archaeon]|nr:hypothetical protein [Candidatus Woesearchaeota archaeon]
MEGANIDYCFRKAVKEFEDGLSALVATECFYDGMAGNEMELGALFARSHPFAQDAIIHSTEQDKETPYVDFTLEGEVVCAFRYRLGKSRGGWIVEGVTVEFDPVLRPEFAQGPDGICARTEHGWFKPTTDAYLRRFHPVVGGTLMTAEMDVRVAGEGGDQVIETVRFNRQYFGMSLPVLENFSNHVGYPGLFNLETRR